MNNEVVSIAMKAVQLYAETHPRPPHVTQVQAAAMLGLSIPTVRKMIHAGTLRLNSCGQIPITEIDQALSAKAA